MYTLASYSAALSEKLERLCRELLLHWDINVDLEHFLKETEIQ